MTNKRKFRYLDFTWMFSPNGVERALKIGIAVVVAICGALVWWVVG